MRPRRNKNNEHEIVITMVGKETFNVRVSPALLSEIDSLVESEKYSSRSDLVSRAIIELLQREGFRPVIREEIREELKSLLTTKEGKNLLSELLKDSG